MRYVFTASVLWLVLPLLALAAIVAAAVLTTEEMQRLRVRSGRVAALESEIAALQLQNQRLALLESELREVGELQKSMLRLAGIEAALGTDIGSLADGSPPPDSVAGSAGPVLWPVRGPIEDGFSVRHPGLDILAPRGQTVLAAGGGVVTRVDIDPEWGRMVDIAHRDSTVTVYGNLALALVDQGDTVRAGEVLGLVGVDRDGVASLYFAVVRDGLHLDPRTVIPQPGPEPTDTSRE